ncbi:MAG: polysaccharide deacetylase family protein [Bacteroidetes bacterium]|nr:MAG: polysaccharide deacetylase family protein [Bacteroidota bacterium]
MYFIRPTLLMRKIYSSAIWRVPTKEKKIFLTFDDGPIPEITPWVLAQLKKHNAKATFFCIGANIDKHSDIFKQIIFEGHSIGNHTYNHLNGWKIKTKEYSENVGRCKTAMDKNHQPSTINHQPFFRPPYGKMKRSQYSILNTQYSVIMWDVLSGDFDQTISEEKCLKNVLTKTREGSIVVFHDNLKAKKNLYYALPKILEYFSEKGFEFDGLTPTLSKGEGV